MGLELGDTVVEIGCGTGANLALLRAAVGDAGRVVGVDLTQGMLTEAQRKVDAMGWSNVELIHADAARFEFPKDIHGVLSTFALSVVPDFDEVIATGARALCRGGRWVVCDLKMPSWPDWVVELGLVITRPYGVDRDAAQRHPWESVQEHLDHSVMQELYFGAAYLISGTKSRRDASTRAGSAA